MLVIIIALGNRALRAPSPDRRIARGRNALSTESTWPLGPERALSIPWTTLVYSFSEPGTGRQVSVIVSRVP